MWNFAQDIRYSLRTLAARPGFTAVFLATLALGIGANTAVFRLVNAVILRMLPVRAPEELVVFEVDFGRGPVSSFSTAFYEQLANPNEVLSGAVAVARLHPKVSAGMQSWIATAEVVSGNYFTVLGVRPAAGRSLTPDDDRPSAHPVCTISYSLWQRVFGGESSAVGKTIRVNSTTLTIVGVTPAAFAGTEPGEAPDVQVPVARGGELEGSGTEQGDAEWLTIIGRLRPGIRTEQVRAAAQLMFDRWAREHRQKPAHVIVRPGGYGVGYLRSMWAKPLLVLMGITILVLVVACANLANLMLARGSARGREIAIRMALGAGRQRVVRQLLTESFVLSAAGAALGVAAASPLTALLLRTAPLIADRNPDVDTGADWRVLLFVAGATVATALLTGLSPALHSTRAGLSHALKELPGGAGRLVLRRALVGGQVALCVVLLTAAGLFARTLHNIQAQNLGFRPDNLVLLTLAPRLSGYSEAKAKVFYEQLLERARAIPGVTSAGLATMVPGSGQRTAMSLRPDGYQPTVGESIIMIVNMITPGYLAAMRIPLVGGRDVGPGDGPGAPKVAIINQRFASRFWPGANAIGKRFNRKGPDDPGFEIIGVIPDQHDPAERTESRLQAYFPLSQLPAAFPQITLHVRAEMPTAALVQNLRTAIAELDRGLPVVNVKTMEGQIRETISSQRLMAHFSAAFGALALLLAAVGLYGVVACGVAQRTREIAIRVALGAKRRHVVRLALGETAGMFAIGVLAGIPAAIAAARVASSMLFGMRPDHPAVYAGVVLVLAATALAAAFVPARRALRVEPSKALRYE